MRHITSQQKTIPTRTVIAFMLIVCFFIPARLFAADFTAKFLGDYGNVTVMEVSGAYDAVTAAENPSVSQRQTIAKEFFKTHKDEYDFLVIFTNFNFPMPERETKAFYQGVLNYTRGLGLPLFDNSSLYGSSGRLQGTVDMGNLANVTSDPLNPDFEETLNTLSHELMHRWGVETTFKNADGSLNMALLGDGENHWSFLLDSAGSVMYGNCWTDNGNGTFTSTTPYKQMKLYSPLDLYLMGMIDKSKVPPMLLINSPNTDSTQLPKAGFTVTGTAQYVTIDQIIEAMGPRVPDASLSQKSFKTAFILITQPGTFTGSELSGIENIRNAEVMRISILTDGRALMEVAATLRENIPANPGVITGPTTPRSLPPNINDGVRWLTINQKPDGSWSDLGQTTERDTAEATLTLKNFDTTQANYQSGILWLGGTSSGNMDFLSRKIQALSGSGRDLTSLVSDVLARQNTDGGWGSDRNYASNPMDTAFALRALSTAGYTGQQAISAAIGYLKAGQNADGGWGKQDQESTIQETSNVLLAFNQYRGAYQLEDAITRGIALLVTRQNSDGGFGNSPSTVYDTARAVMTLSELNASSGITNNALAYLLSRQSDNGSWNESSYQTALAVETVYKATVDPDLSITPEDISFIPANVTSLPTNVVISASIRNSGATSVPLAKVVLYDGTPETGTRIGEQFLAFPGQASTTVTFSAAVNDGNEHVYTIVIDPDNLVKESNELNNREVKALYPQATYDFEILMQDISVSTNPANFLQDVTITSKITNKGTMNAYNVQVKYYIDDLVAPFEIATQTVDIPAGATITSATTWRANKAGVNLPLTVIIDPFNSFTELSRTNNKAIGSITVIAQNLTAPNLSISYKDITVTPDPALERGSISIAALVKNNGFVTSDAIAVNFYQGVPGQGGLLLATQTIAELLPGNSIQATAVWTNIQGSGEKIVYIQVVPGSQTPEIREDDNEAFTTVHILSIPELSISPDSIAFSDAFPKEGDQVVISARVENKGEQGASNVPVRFTEAGAIIGTQTIDFIAANGTAVASMNYDTTGRKGSNLITVTVDPVNMTPEHIENDNTASRTLEVQDASLWVTEPYFSPNGDGIKDSTQFFFRLDTAQTVTVAVAGKDGKIVRTFAQPEFINTTSSMVTWDGLSDGGKTVPDGQYQVQVVDPGNKVLKKLMVVVDNNRSPLIDALGTKFIKTDNLTCTMPRYEAWSWLPDNSGLVFSIFRSNDYTPSYSGEYSPGLFVMDADGMSYQKTTPWSGEDECVEPPCGMDWSKYKRRRVDNYVVSPDGAKVVVKVERDGFDWGGGALLFEGTELWVENRDGSGLTMLDSCVYEYPAYEEIGSISWSPDGKFITYLHINYSPSYSADLILLDVERQVKIVLDSGRPADIAWSPNSEKLAFTHNAAECELRVSDKLGNQQSIPQCGRSNRWLSNRKFASQIASAVRLFDLNEIPNGTSVSDDVDRMSYSPGSNSFALSTGIDGATSLVLYINGEIYEPSQWKARQCTMNFSGVIWSADGGKAALPVTCSGTASVPEFDIIDLTGKNENFIPAGNLACYQWLSDGTSLLCNNAAHNYSSYVINSDNGDTKPLQSDEFGGAWASPSGNYITYYKPVDSSQGCYQGYYHSCYHGDWWSCGDFMKSSDLWTMSSLLNLVVDLKILKRDSTAVLYGTAADLNLEGWKIEYADVSAPDTWNFIVPYSDTAVLSDTFIAWVPPYEGSFYIKLTVWDKAGNASTSETRMSWGATSAITNISKSLDFFSPNGDGVKDTVDLRFIIREPVHLEFNIYDSTNNLVRTFYKDYAVATTSQVTWDGKNETGEVVADGAYRIKVAGYEFAVEVDNSPPQVASFLSSIKKDNANAIFTELKGHVVDRNPGKWTISYGTGDNPLEWTEFMSGSAEVVKKDEQGNPLLNAEQDPTINKFSESDFSFIVGKKFRVTAEDLAGNKSTAVSGFLEERLIFDRYEGDEVGTAILPDLPSGATYPLKVAAGPHNAGGLIAMRSPLSSLNVQYRINRQWFDSSPLLQNPHPGIILAEWYSPGKQVNSVRLKTVDLQGNQYYSNEINTANLFWLEPCQGKGYNNLAEDLQSLNVQIRNPQDPRYAVWTDIAAFTVSNMPEGPFDLSLPSDLQTGLPYSLRMVGVGVSGKQYIADGYSYPSSQCSASVNASLEVGYKPADCGLLSGRAELSVKWEASGKASLKTLSYYMQKPSGLELLRQYDLSREISGTVNVSTAVLAEGSYPVKAVFGYVNLSTGAVLEAIAEGTLVVDRVFPSAHITYPDASVRLCRTRIYDAQGERYQINVEGKAADNNQVRSYELLYGIGDNPSTWAPAMDLTGKPIAGTNSVDGLLGSWDITGIKESSLALKLKVTDKSGNVSCATTSVLLDTTADITGLTIDRSYFSPNGDGVLDDVTVGYRVDEYASTWGKVFELVKTDGNYVPGPSSLRTIQQGARHPGGIAEIVWDGRKDDGAIVPDGHYGIGVFTTDSCGNETHQWTAVEVDNVAPVADISYPQPGVQLGTIVGIIGTASDLHFHGYKLEAGPGAAPVEWSLVSSGSSPVTDGFLGSWNTYGLNGTWTLRLTAFDAAGNKTETKALVDLGARYTLLKTLNASPALFSPNNDGNLDATTIQFELTDTCYVNIDIIDVNDAVKRTYAFISIPAGVQSQVWDGMDADGVIVPDGKYSARITAVLSGMTGTNQVEKIPLTVDNAPPAIDIRQPVDRSFVRNDITVLGNISDVNLSEYSVFYSGPTGTVMIDRGNQGRDNYIFGILHDLQDGPYTLTVSTKDSGGNTTEKTTNFIVDRTAPTLSLSSPQDGDYYGGTKPVVNISGSVVEQNLGAFTLSYGMGDSPLHWTELTRGTILPASSQLFSWQVGINDGVPDGMYTLLLEVQDQSGSAAASRAKLIVDNTPPVVSILYPGEGAFITAETDVRGSILDANLDNYSVEMSEGSCAKAYKWVDIKTASAVVQDGSLASWRALPPDGAYCLKVTATDKAGNATAAMVGVTVAAHSVSALILSGYMDVMKNAHLSWTDVLGSPSAGYNIFRDNQRLNAEPITGTTYLDPNLGEGIYIYTVQAVDFSGAGKGSSNQVALTVQIDRPVTRIQIPQDGGRVSCLVDIKGTAYSNAFKQYRVFAGAGQSPTSWNILKTSQLPVTYGVLAQWDTTGLAEGAYVLKLEAEDMSGNITTKQITVIVDNTIPTRPVLLSAIPDGSMVTLTWQANTEGDLAGYLLYRNNQIVNSPGVYVGNIRPYLISGQQYSDVSLPDGTLDYYVVAMDQAGNMSESSNNIRMTLDNRAPHAVINSPAAQAVFDHQILVQAVLSDNDIQFVQFQYKRSQDATWTNLGSPATAIPFSTNFDPAGLGLSFGTYALQAVAKDIGGRTDPSPSPIEVTYKDFIPPAAPQNVMATTNGGNVSLAWSGNTEADLSGYNIYKLSGATSTKINTTLIGQPSYQDSNSPDGNYSYLITAVDTSGNESAPSFPATASIYAPFLVQTSPTTTQAQLPINGSNTAPSAIIEFFVDSGSGPIAQGTIGSDGQGNFFFTVTLQQGTNLITARARDASGNSSRYSNALSVTCQAPTLPLPPYSFTATASGYNVALNWKPSSGSSISYNVYKSTDQGWAKINTYPVWLWYLPYTDANLKNGTYTYRVTAVDSLGVESLPSTIASTTVNNAPPQPPSWISAVSLAEGWLSISWLPNPGTTAAGYNIYRSATAGGPYSKVNAYTINHTSFADQDVQNGSSYYYVATAVDPAKTESGYSQETMGTAMDTVAPDKPLFDLATGGVHTAHKDTMEICGRAEPGSLVTLYKNGGYQGTVYADPDLSVRYDLGGVVLDGKSAALSPDGRWLLHTAGLTLVVTELATGSTVTVAVPSGAQSFLWSPDGSKFSYIYWDNSGQQTGIYDIATGLSQVAAPGMNISIYNLTWSPDGTKIVFTGSANGSYGIWTEDLVTQVVTPIVTGATYKSSPRISPVGDKIAYFEGQSIYLRDMTTGNTMLLDTSADGGTLAWSPDGSALAFLSTISGYRQIFIYNLATGNKIQLTSLAAANISVSSPQWTQAGDKIIFMKFDSMSQNKTLLITPASELGTARLLKDDLSLTFISRSPDGSIVYVDHGMVNILKFSSPFVFANVPLDAGENLFTATAADEARNVSGPSDELTVFAVVIPHAAINAVTSPVNRPDQIISGTMDSGATVTVACSTALPGLVSYPSATTWQTTLTNMQEGSNTISVTAANTAGEISDAATHVIVVDTMIPLGSIAMNNGAAYTNSITASLTLSCIDATSGCAQMSFSDDNNTWTTWETYTPGKTWLLSTGDGAKFVYVKYKDAAGNMSVTYSASVVLDTTPPATSASSQGGLFSQAQSVSLTANEAATIYYTMDETAPTADSSVYAGPLSIQATTMLQYFAIDAAGNRELVKNSTFTIAPDLLTTPDDLSLYPGYPIAGELTALNAVVWNRSIAPAQDIEVSMYLWSYDGTLALLKKESLASLTPGGSAVISALWDSSGKAGEHRLVVAIDPESNVLEADETNNLAFIDFYVSDHSRADMTTTLDDSVYSSDQQVQITVSLRNNGVARDVVLDAAIEDANGNTITGFDEMNITIPYTDAQNYVYLWNTQNTYAGAYQVHAALRDYSGILAEHVVPFSITPDSDVASSLAIDKPSYGPGENATLQYTVTNRGTNYILPSVTATLEISDAGGNILFQSEKNINNLLPGSPAAFSSSWNTGMNPPGDYKAILTITNGGIVASSVAGFKIKPSAAVTGNITVSQGIVPVNSMTQVSYVLTNQGNADADGFVAVITIMDSSAQNVIDTRQETINLPKGASWTGQLSISSAGLDLNTYSVVLQSIYQSITERIASASFTVLDVTPPILNVVSPESGKLYTSAVTFSTTAMDDASGVQKVEYRIDNGEWYLLPPADLTQGRYTTTWYASAADGGRHIVSFRATDKAENTSTPAPVTFVVQTDTTPPVLILSALPNGAYTNNVVLNVAGTITDNISVQSLSINDTAVTWAADGSFSQVLTLTTGTNAITTSAVDSAGNTATDIRTIILDQTAPAIVITNPADNSVTNEINSTVTGTVDETATVNITINGGNPIVAAMTGNAFSLPITYGYGQNTIEVTATDLTRNPGTAKRTVTFDDVSPALAVTYPPEDMTTSQNQITVTGQVSDLTPVAVIVTVDGNTYAPTVENGSFTQTITFTAQKKYKIDVTAVDEAGNRSLVQRNVVYSAIPQNFGVFGATVVVISGGYVDSYDSTQGAYNGVHGSNVSVGTNSAAKGAVNFSGGAAVYGDVYVGPGGDPAKAITTSGGAIIYGTEGALSMIKGMTPVSDPGGGTSLIIKNGMTLASGIYRVNSINLSGSGIVTINGNVTLIVTGSLNLSGGARIVILPGGSLTVYLAGKLNVSGGSIVNETFNPHNLMIYGTPTCSTANYSGNSAFYGVIYAPAAKTTISGGNDIYGSVIGGSVNISGGSAVHYDESLGSGGR